MQNQEISITDATDAQLLDFARNKLNLDVDGRSSRATVLAKIAAVHDRDTIQVDAAKADGRPAKTQRAADPMDTESRRKLAQEARSARELGDTRKGPMRMQGEFDVPHYEIELAKAEGPGGDAPVPVWVNGRQLIIPRGKRVEIPGPYLGVLENAVRTEIVQSERYGDNGREIVTTTHDSAVYPVRIVRGPYFPDANMAA